MEQAISPFVALAAQRDKVGGAAAPPYLVFASRQIG
jgi:hypothetical protein